MQKYDIKELFPITVGIVKYYLNWQNDRPLNSDVVDIYNDRSLLPIEVGTLKDAELADKIISWINKIYDRETVDSSKDKYYILEMHRVVNSSDIDFFDIDTLVSACIAYLKSHNNTDMFGNERKSNRNTAFTPLRNNNPDISRTYSNRRETSFRQRKPSEWIGDIGDTVTVQIKNGDINARETRKPNRYLCTAYTTNDEKLMWFNEGYIDGVYSLLGTVKDHAEYNGIKETVLDNVKVVK